ncbi:MAG: DUF2905 domain-containing protein [Planctomycetota bacterium]|nr:MAG: DUF2905 domain-containing protein [Planctomycetota bacterium]
MKLGNVLIGIGLALLVLGLLLRLAPWLFGWFGRLPGDVHIERDGFSLWVPITSMLLVSAVLTLLLNLIDRLR